MRKLFSAGVLITAATAAALLPSAAAHASPPEEAEWTYVEDYFHLADCRYAGEHGVLVGEWDAYDCIFDVVPGEWNLYAANADDDDNGDDGGDEEGEYDD